MEKNILNDATEYHRLVYLHKGTLGYMIKKNCYPKSNYFSHIFAILKSVTDVMKFRQNIKVIINLHLSDRIAKRVFPI